MKRRLVTSTVVYLALSASAFAQDVCEMRGAISIPLLEEAKARFLSTDFAGFVALMEESMGSAADPLREPLGKLTQIVPDGFDSCQVIAQRRDVGGMIQEVSTFSAPGELQPVSLYLLVMPVRDEMIVGQVNFNTSVGPVVGSLK